MPMDSLMSLNWMQGVVANFVETEQIVEITTPKAKYISAFVQIRGSIPLLWSQIPSVKYKPTTRLAPPEAYRPAFDKHMTDLAKSYKVGFVITWNFIFLFFCSKVTKIEFTFFLQNNSSLGQLSHSQRTEHCHQSFKASCPNWIGAIMCW